MLRRFTAVLGFVCAALAVALAASGARTVVSLRIANQRLQSIELPKLPEPGPASRIMIVSPHPDDETLACGGLIQRAISRGAKVSVVVLTSGDGFPASAAAVFRRIDLSPSDYVRLGQLRRKEVTRALVTLGVPEHEIVLLGYPDRGLRDLWTANWSQPKASSYTRCTASPYETPSLRKSTYSGLSLVQDLKDLILLYSPTEIYIPHPNDDHEDHRTAGCFVVAALESLRKDGALGSPEPELITYLVHRGDWPVPQGLKPNRRLVPPDSLWRLDTRWLVLPLTKEEIARKLTAIRIHRSQVALPNERRFMLSFVRTNELFGLYKWVLGPPADEVPTPTLDQQFFAVFDPISDRVQENLQPSTDIDELSVLTRRDRVTFRIETAGRVASWVGYRVRVWSMGSSPENCRSAVFDIRPSRRRSADGVERRLWDRVAEISVPVVRLSSRPSLVMVAAETTVGGLVVDRTAWRACRLP
ncbi:MAG: PIG-L deacetylase family protein [Armatimonadota bacterium]